MQRAVIIINGQGGVGKDTLIEYVRMTQEFGDIDNVSSIDPIKDMAKIVGWKGTKDSKSRKFLSDLKQLVIEYNDYPEIYLGSKYYEFIRSDKQLLFIHIREPEEIKKFKLWLHEEWLHTGLYYSKPAVFCTVLVQRDDEITDIGNVSDDGVFDYKYDKVFVNSFNESIESNGERFIELLKDIMNPIGN